MSISDIPWKGPVAAVRIGRIDDKFIINPTYEQIKESKLNMVFAALENENQELLINMMEGDFEEAEESLIIEAYHFAKEYLKKILD